MQNKIMNWYKTATLEDFYPKLIKALNKYKGKGFFVHYTKIPKIGINIHPSHSDPIGIYLFPLDYVADNIGNMQSYFTFFPYMFVCNINTSNILNLGTLTEEEVNKILKTQKIKRQYGTRGGEDKEKSSPGGDLWYSIEKSLPQDWSSLGKKNIVFFNALKNLGIDAIYDPGTGAIHPNEPHQILVLNPRVIEVIELVETGLGHGKGSPSSDYYDNPKYPFYSQTTKPALLLLESMIDQLGFEKASNIRSSGRGSWSVYAKDQKGNYILLYVKLSRSGIQDYKSFFAEFRAFWHSDGEEFSYEGGEMDQWQQYPKKEFTAFDDYKEITKEFTTNLKQELKENPMDDTSYAIPLLQQIKEAYGKGQISQRDPLRGTITIKEKDFKLMYHVSYEKENNLAYVSGSLISPKASGYYYSFPLEFINRKEIKPNEIQDNIKEISISGLKDVLQRQLEAMYKEDYRGDYLKQQVQKAIELIRERK